jgi:hypothetical protein
MVSQEENNLSPKRDKKNKNKNDQTHLSARDIAEKRKQKVAYSIGGALVGIILLIILVGYYREFYSPPRIMAGEVRGVKFAMSDLVQRIRVLQGLNRYDPEYILDLGSTPFEFLQKLVHAEILKQAAPGLGIGVTEEEIQEELRAQFYPEIKPGEETGSNQLEQEFKSNYRAFLTATTLTEEQYEGLLAEVIRERKLTLSFFMNMESPQEQVEISLIVLNRDSSIPPDEIRSQIDKEDFETVARDIGQEDGYFGWVPNGAFPEFNNFIFPEDGSKKATGDISDLLITESGIFIIKILSDYESKDVEDPIKYKLALETMDKWEAKQLQTGSEEGWVKLNFDSEKYSWVANQVKLTAPRIIK